MCLNIQAKNVLEICFDRQLRFMSARAYLTGAKDPLIITRSEHLHPTAASVLFFNVAQCRHEKKPNGKKKKFFSKQDREKKKTISMPENKRLHEV